jgi:glutamyl/glutaminyl-tRNA synthetase
VPRREEGKAPVRSRCLHRISREAPREPRHRRDHQPVQNVRGQRQQGVTAETLPKILSLLQETLSGIGDWTLAQVQEKLTAAIEAGGYKKGQVLWPLRAVLTGKKFSPGAFEVATALGKEESLKRLSAVRL